MVIINSAGRVTIAAANTAAPLYLGVAESAVTTSSAADDEILVYDNPLQIFQGQCSGNGALVDPYTTSSYANGFDIEGTTGIMEIDENATSIGVIKIVGVGKEPNGDASAVGANQKKLFRINMAAHVLGSAA
jgi:hypothetical protein